MRNLKNIKKIIYNVLLLSFVFLTVSYCNNLGKSDVLKRSTEHLKLNILHTKDYAFAHNEQNSTNITHIQTAHSGKYKFFLESKDSEVLVLKFSPKNLYAQVLVNGKLKYSNIEGTLDILKINPYIPISLSPSQIIKVEIFVYPIQLNPLLSREIELELLPFSEFSTKNFFQNLFYFFILIGLLFISLFARKKTILINTLSWFGLFSLSVLSIRLEIIELFEFLLKYEIVLKLILALSQIFILKYLYYRFTKLQRFSLFPFISFISLWSCFIYNIQDFLTQNYFILSYFLLQNFLLSLRVNLIIKRNVKYLLQILNSYKRELQLIRGDFLKSQNEFYQKILDKSFHLVTYMEKLEIQSIEVETLNKLIIQLLEENDIDQVLNTIFEHLHTYYKADITFIYFFNPQTNEFYAYKGSSRNIPSEVHEFLLNTKMPLSKEAGYSYIAYKRKKIIYKENAKTKFKKVLETNSNLTYLPEVLSSVYIPILVRNEFQGIFFLASFNHSMNLTKEKLKYISMFTNQVASAIQKQKILLEMENEKQKAERAKLAAEEAMQEIEAINSLAKDINENLDLKFIMTKIMEFVESHYGIHYYSLYFVNSKKTKVKLLDAKFPSEVTPPIRKKISEIEFPLGVERGAHAFIYKSQKMIYFKNLGNIYISEEEAQVLSYLNIASMIGIPLKLKGEILGILSFYSSQKLKLSKRQLKTIAALGEQVAGAIHNSRLYKEIQQEKEKSDNLLLSILPPKIASELKNKGKVVPVSYESATILFTDFVGFTKIAEKLKPEQLLIELDGYFTYFDFICERFNLEKLKTIGDSYMCAGGLPNINYTHPLDACLAAMEFRDFTVRMQEVARVSKEDLILWELRIGVHTGPLIGGVIGTTKFAFDVWGDSVNIASRTESSGETGKINISESTYELVKEFFVCEYRGKIPMKNKGSMGMYFLYSLKPEYSENPEGTLPNQKFWEIYEKIKLGEVSLLEISSQKESLLKVI